MNTLIDEHSHVKSHRDWLHRGEHFSYCRKCGQQSMFIKCYKGKRCLICSNVGCGAVVEIDGYDAP